MKQLCLDHFTSRSRILFKLINNTTEKMIKTLKSNSGVYDSINNV